MIIIIGLLVLVAIVLIIWTVALMISGGVGFVVAITEVFRALRHRKDNSDTAQFTAASAKRRKRRAE